MPNLSLRPRVQCQCYDQGCPAHTGVGYCREETYPKNVLYRVDMTDESGTVFCPECLQDALESGLFTSSKEN